MANSASTRGQRSNVTQDEVNQAEWENSDNWTGPPGLSIYFSRQDSRFFVRKQLLSFGPTMNLGTTCGFYWLFFGTLVLVAAAFMLGRCTV